MSGNRMIITHTEVRTFLVWVRTAIAVMAFGFLVEKFDLFLEVAAPSLAGRTLSLPGQKFGNAAGLALIVLGTAMVAIAALRFVRNAKNIDQKELRPGADRGSISHLQGCWCF
jgi:putative membrane protein